MKIFGLALIFAVATSLYANDAAEKPTLEQLMTSHVAKISFEITRDENTYDAQAWEKIVTAVSALVDLCQVSPQGDHNPQLFQEVYRVIDLMRNEQQKNKSGLNALLSVSVGTEVPAQNQPA
jgi:hypothetical protein